MGDEVTRAITLAFVGFIFALATQFVLRADQTRRETRLRLLNDLSTEQSLHEKIAYKARKLVLQGLEKDEPRKLRALIDEALFEGVYQKSNIVTLCAELESIGIYTSRYVVSTMQFRGRCEQIVEVALMENNQSSIDICVDKLRDEIIAISEDTKVLTTRINHHFASFWSS